MNSQARSSRWRRRRGSRPPWLVPALLLLLCVCLAVLASGCGRTGASSRSRSAPASPGAAGPAQDPRLSGHPAGREVRVGTDPQGIAVDARAGIVAVGVHDPNRVVLLGASSGRILARVAITAAPRHLEFVAPAGPFLIPEERADRLAELSVNPLSLRSYAVGSFPHDAAGAAGRVFVTDERGRSVTEILPDGRRATIGGFRQPGGVAVSGGDIAVVDVGAFTLTLLDARTAEKIGRLPAGRGPTHDVADATDIYVADTRGDAILTYRTHPFALIGRTPLPGSPYGLALDPVNHRLWVTQTGLNRVTELSTSGRLPRGLDSFATDLQPDTVAVDSATGRVFVADQRAGTVEIIDPPQ